MDDLFGSGSFLGTILGVNQGGGGATPFGSLGGGSAPPAASGAPLQLDPSTIGSGAPAAGAPTDINSSGPGGNQPNVLQQIGARLGLWNQPAPAGQPGGPPTGGNTNILGGPQGGNPAMNKLANQLTQAGQPKIIQTPQFQWLQPAGPR